MSTGLQTGEILTSGAPAVLIENFLPEDSQIKDILGSYSTVKEAMDAATALGLAVPESLASELANAGIGLYGEAGTWFGPGPAQTGSLGGAAAPIIGGALSGYMAYQQTGEVGDAITAAFFTGVGTLLGGPIGGMAGSMLSGMFMSSPNTVSIPENAQVRFTTPMGQVGLEMAGIGNITAGGSPQRFTIEELDTAMTRIRDIQIFDSAVDNAFKQLAQTNPDFDEEYSRNVVLTQQSGVKYNLNNNPNAKYGATKEQRWDDYVRMIPALSSLVESQGLDMDSFIDAYGSSAYNLQGTGMNEAYWSDMNNIPLYQGKEGVYGAPTGASTTGEMWYTPGQTILQGDRYANIHIDPTDIQTWALLDANPDVAEALNAAPNSPDALTYNDLKYLVDYPEMISTFYG